MFVKSSRNSNNNINKINKILKGEGGKLTGKKATKLIEHLATQEIKNQVYGTLRRYCIKMINQNVPLNMIGTVGELVKLVTQYSAPNNHTVERETESVNIKTSKYVTYINENAKGKFNQEPFQHSRKKIVVFDSGRDLTEMGDRLQCITHGGASQSTIDIFDECTFISIEQMYNLVNLEEELNIHRKDREEQLKESTEGFKEDLKKRTKRSETLKKLAINQENSFGKDRLHSLVPRINSVLYINSDLCTNVTHIRIFLCTHRQFKRCDGKKGALEPKEIYNNILKDIETDETRSIKKTDLIKYENSKTLNSNAVKHTMWVQPGCDIRNCESIKDHIKVLKTYTVNLKPSESVKIDVKHNYPYGIDLFDLEKCEKNTASAHTFFIVQAVGSNARISLNENPDIKHNVTSPVKLRYEFSCKVSFISKDTNRKRDIPITIKNKGKNINFEDSELAELFHPKRENKFNVDYEHISIGGSNPKAKYSLDMDVETALPSKIRNLNYIAESKNVDLEEALQLLNEQEEFVNQANSTKHNSGDSMLNIKNILENNGEFFEEMGYSIDPQDILDLDNEEDEDDSE